MKPGDIIEWRFKGKNTTYNVGRGCMLISSSMEKEVPIGSDLLHMLISIDDVHITWINSDGIFSANREDARRPWTTTAYKGVVPRVVKDSL